MGTPSVLPSLIALFALTLTACGGGSHNSTADDSSKTISQKADELLGIPPDWHAANGKSAEAYRAGRYVEAAMILEDYAKAHPSFPDAELMLGDHYVMVPSADKAAERENSEKAVVHYQRGLQLVRDDAMGQRWGARGLIGLFGPLELDRPADAEQVARDYTKARPSDAYGYTELATQLRRQKKFDEGTRVLREGNARVTDEKERREYFEGLIDHAEASPSIPPADQRQLLADAGPFVEESLKANPKDYLALGIKAKMTAVEARLETNAAKRKTLEAESKRLEKASADALSEAAR